MASNKAATATPGATAQFTLQFGLVSIPVAMRPATSDRDHGVKGRMLCPEHMVAGADALPLRGGRRADGEGRRGDGLRDLTEVPVISSSCPTRY